MRRADGNGLMTAHYPLGETSLNSTDYRLIVSYHTESITEHLILTCIFRFWATDEPNGHTLENCVVNVDHNRRWPTLSGWLDIACNSDFKGICEKRTAHIDLVQV